MVDLGSDDLLREFARRRVVANETEWSKGVLQKLCPDSADHDPRFQRPDRQFSAGRSGFQTINAAHRQHKDGSLSSKGFHHLIAASAMLRIRRQFEVRHR